MIVLVIFIISKIYSGELLFLLKINRHGSRLPFSISDNKESDLTIRGFFENINIGRQMKADYKNLFNNSVRKEYKVISSHRKRCNLSSIGQLEGIYGHRQRLNKLLTKKNLKSEILDSQYLSYEIDLIHKNENFVFKSRRFCDPLDRELRKHYIDDLITSYWEKNIERSLKSNEFDFKNYSGLEIKFDHFGKIYDYYMSKTSNQETLYFNRNTTQQLKTLKSYVKMKKFDGFKLPQISSFNFLLNMTHEIQDNFEKINKNEEFYKLIAYNAHDSTIFPLLILFNITKIECLNVHLANGSFIEEDAIGCISYPDYNAEIKFEFLRKDKEIHVKCFYNDLEFFLGEKTQQLSLDKFYKVILDQLNCGYYKFCNKKENEIKKETKSSKLNSLLVIFGICIFIYKIYKKYRTNGFSRVANVNNIC